MGEMISWLWELASDRHRLRAMPRHERSNSNNCAAKGCLAVGLNPFGSASKNVVIWEYVYSLMSSFYSGVRDMLVPLGECSSIYPTNSPTNELREKSYPSVPASISVLLVNKISHAIHQLIVSIRLPLFSPPSRLPCWRKHCRTCRYLFTH